VTKGKSPLSFKPAQNMERGDLLLARLLSVATPQEACVQVSQFSDAAAADVLVRLAAMPGGGLVVAQLVGHLSPLVAVK
jgi:hypothetical protein